MDSYTGTDRPLPLAEQAAEWENNPRTNNNTAEVRAYEKQSLGWYCF